MKSRTFNRTNISKIDEAKKMDLEEKLFWEKVGNILDEETIEIWEGFDKFSSKYHSLLLERKKNIE